MAESKIDLSGCGCLIIILIFAAVLVLGSTAATENTIEIIKAIKEQIMINTQLRRKSQEEEGRKREEEEARSKDHELGKVKEDEGYYKNDNILGQTRNTK